MMTSLQPTPVSPIPLHRSYLSKNGGRYEIRNPNKEAFKRMIERAGLKSSFDEVLEQSGVAPLLDKLLEENNLSAAFEDALIKHRLGGYSQHGPHRWHFTTVDNAVINFDDATGTVWVQGRATNGKTEAALDSILGLPL